MNWSQQWSVQTTNSQAGIDSVTERLVVPPNRVYIRGDVRMNRNDLELGHSDGYLRIRGRGREDRGAKRGGCGSFLTPFLSSRKEAWPPKLARGMSEKNFLLVSCFPGH